MGPSVAMPPAPSSPAPTLSDGKARTCEDKRALRLELRTRRAEVPPGSPEAKAAAEAIAAHLAADPRVLRAQRVAVYAAVGAELDPGAIARGVRARGGQVFYPRVVQTVPPQLTFHRHDPPSGAIETAGLTRGVLGVLEPAATAPEAERIDVFIVPGLGFDPSGNRLGTGRGFYDAALRAQPEALRIGIGFAAQLVDAIPHDEHDEPVDVVVTPDGPRETRARSSLAAAVASPAGSSIRPSGGESGPPGHSKREVSP